MIYRLLLETFSEPDALGVHSFHSPVSSDRPTVEKLTLMKRPLNFRNAACILSTRWRDLAANCEGGWKRKRPKIVLNLRNTYVNSNLSSF